jgi:hypothetical protein
MKHQVLILINYKEDHPGNSEIIGLVKNCTTDEDLMNTLANCAEFGHDVEVKTLEDDEPWPTLMERLEA